jgi:hypothetical protein
VTGCDAHPGAGADIGEELRALALSALDKVDPVLERLREQPTATGAETCAVCPVCAVVAAVRGERPELAARLAEHATGLVAVLRAALEEGAPGSGPAAPPEPAPTRRVQRIHVERQASC